jgi:hypothetical protein
VSSINPGPASKWEETIMKIRALAAALALVAFSAPAFAGHCPSDMAKIDAALAGNPGLGADQLAKVTELRAAGEKLHIGGKHGQSVAALGEAMEILGIQ